MQDERASQSPADNHDDLSEDSSTQDEASANESDNQDEQDGDRSGGRPRKKKKSLRDSVLPELRKLSELTTRYPEIGAPLAELAMKLGHRQLGQSLVNIAIEGGPEGVDARFLAADLARREGRSEDVLDHVLSALALHAASDEQNANRDTRILHLIRQGFAVVMFDLGDVSAYPEFSQAVTDRLIELADRYVDDAFYYTLLAQAQWCADPELSEQSWELAIELGEPEATWNARGTWYKEAERDLEHAEQAYLQGLEAAPASALLLHNLAQIMMIQASDEDLDPEEARRKLLEARNMLRRSLKYGMRVTLRRHIHETIERLDAQLTTLPVSDARDGRQSREPREPRERRQPREPRERRQPTPPPKVGDIVTGRVRSLTIYGVFLSISREQSGLLHKSEIGHAVIEDPADHYNIGDEIEVQVIDVKPQDDGTLRVSFSTKGLDAPADSYQDDDHDDENGSVQVTTRVPRTAANFGAPSDDVKLTDQTLGNRSRQRQPRGEQPTGTGRARRRDSQGSASSKNVDTLGTLGDLLRSRLNNDDDSGSNR